MNESTPLPVGAIVRVIASWIPEERRDEDFVVYGVHEYTAAAAERYLYDLGGVGYVPDYQVEFTGRTTRVWKCLCPEHGYVARWARDEKPQPCGCPRENCTKIVDITPMEANDE